MTDGSPDAPAPPPPADAAPPPAPPAADTTIIGPGVKIEGRIAFTDHLRVSGEIVGDVAGRGDRPATVIVEAPGRITGAVAATHIVLKGATRGPLDAAESIEVHAGGRGEGDATYRSLDIRRGGILVGTLTPSAAGPARPPATTAETARGRTLRLVVYCALTAAVFATGVVTLRWMLRSPPPAAAVPAPAVAEAAPPGTPATPPGTSAPTSPDDQPPAPQSAVASPAPDAIVAVQGGDADKVANVVYVVTREPVVLYRKKRGESSAGTRVELASGRNLGVPVARSEVLRVAEGRAVDLFYQGRKVPPSLVESGAWLQFVPLAAHAAADAGQ